MTMRPEIGINTCHGNDRDPDCYGCRRYDIDVMALHIYDREMRWLADQAGSFDVERHAASQALQYRNRKVNELTMEFANFPR